MPDEQYPHPDDARTLAGAFAAAGLRVATAGRPAVDDMDAALLDTAVLESCGAAVRLVDLAIQETAARLQRSGAATLRAAESVDQHGAPPPSIPYCL
ncbi:hypothetical protein OHB12_29100 [Nocardia sp. NBC_01730]|uniref:hypothetical protein n=1 Tax=Nocardia sp. NBC_01730 TaxID=2975998 RepID=UPI002E0FC329|nr:hypothetical protein OHB12_29100 [Nocardia sp. NBC_01730]